MAPIKLDTRVANLAERIPTMLPNFERVDRAKGAWLVAQKDLIEARAVYGDANKDGRSEVDLKRAENHIKKCEGNLEARRKEFTLAQEAASSAFLTAMAGINSDMAAVLQDLVCGLSDLVTAMAQLHLRAVGRNLSMPSLLSHVPAMLDATRRLTMVLNKHSR